MDTGVRNTVAILVAIVAVVFGLQFWQVSKNAPLDIDQLKNYNAYIYKEARNVLDFELINHNEEVFSKNDLVGDGWKLVNFGYTFCPDICPTNMLYLNTLLSELEQAQQPLPQVYMVTVDPKRDDPHRMREYVSFFNESFMGITGDEKMIAALARQMNNVYVVAPGGNEEVYFVDHSDNIAIINPEGQTVGIFRSPHKPEKMAQAMMALMSNS